MDKQEFLKKLMATFLVELDEHVRSLNHQLLILEKAENEPDVHSHLRTLLQTAHCLKGAARAVSVQEIEQGIHKLESLFAGYRQKPQSIPSEFYTLFFKTVDAVEEAGMRLREEQPLDGSPIQLLLPLLDRVIESGTVPREELERLPIGIEPHRKLTGEPLSASVTPEESPPVADIPTPSQPAPSKSRGTSSVRISAEKLDELLTQTGELMVAAQRMSSRSQELKQIQTTVATWKSEWWELLQAIRRQTRKAGMRQFADSSGFLLQDEEARQLEQAADRLSRLQKLSNELVAHFEQDAEQLELAVRGLEEDVHEVRLFPFGEVQQGLERAVRDLTETSGKQAELILRGRNVQMDRSVLEAIKDPLLHLVRNAVDHGIELPSERAEQGKHPLAKILVTAALRGSQIELSVEDDGRGIDLNRIRRRALARQIPVPASEADLARLLFLPGFSTSEMVTQVSGRGVGLDVVKSRIESLHGTVDVRFQQAKGTRFEITVPLTLTTIRSVLVRARGQTFALASPLVDRFLPLRPEMIQLVGGRQTLMLNDRPLPIADLGAFLNLLSHPDPLETSPELVMVVATGDQTMAFLIDAVLGEQEILIKSLGPRIRKLRYVSGATVLPSGEIVLVLNVGNLVRIALLTSAEVHFSLESKPYSPQQARLLVVDDSATTRALMKSILETAGYLVTMALDGADALEKLATDRFDLVVTDVDMPLIDGCELTRRIRQSEQWSELPVVLITARDDETDKARGLNAGANHYVTKGAFNQDELLTVIQQLL